MIPSLYPRLFGVTALSLILGLGFFGCAPASMSSGSAPAAVAADAVAADAVSSRAPAVELHDLALYADPRIGLHHFLFEWARTEIEPEPRDWRRPLEIPEKQDLAELSTEEREIWEAALSAYREQAVRYHLLFNRGLQLFRAQLLPPTESTPPFLVELQQTANEKDLQRVKLLAEAFEPALDVYLRHWWPGHQRENQAWITAVTPPLERYGHTLAAGLAKAYQGKFPAGPVRVDVSPYAGDLGAYTTQGPHIMITSRNPGYQELRSLEMLFHESSHTPELIGALTDPLKKVFAAQDAKVPRDLWHVILFHTAGEITRKTLAADGIEYTPYADHVGLWKNNRRWGKMRESVIAHWQPYLDGEVGRAEALAALAAALAPASS